MRVGTVVLYVKNHLWLSGKISVADIVSNQTSLLKLSCKPSVSIIKEWLLLLDILDMYVNNYIYYYIELWGLGTITPGSFDMTYIHANAEFSGEHALADRAFTPLSVQFEKL